MKFILERILLLTNISFDAYEVGDEESLLEGDSDTFLLIDHQVKEIALEQAPCASIQITKETAAVPPKATQLDDQKEKPRDPTKPEYNTLMQDQPIALDKPSSCWVKDLSTSLIDPKPPDTLVKLRKAIFVKELPKSDIPEFMLVRENLGKKFKK